MDKGTGDGKGDGGRRDGGKETRGRRGGGELMDMSKHQTFIKHL